MLDKWGTSDLLGGRIRSKTIKPQRYMEARHLPEVTYLALRAWMLWRMQWHRCRFLESKRSRMEAWKRESVSLRWAIFFRGGPEALPATAREDILLWAPHTLSREAAMVPIHVVV